MTGRYKFIGLAIYDARPHYFEHLIANKIYEINKPRSIYRTVVDENGNTLIVSNTSLQKYFRKMSETQNAKRNPR